MLCTVVIERFIVYILYWFRRVWCVLVDTICYVLQVKNVLLSTRGIMYRCNRAWSILMEDYVTYLKCRARSCRHDGLRTVGIWCHFRIYGV